jgi:pimeloyl-ACP methyl ester carboxylesterase
MKDTTIEALPVSRGSYRLYAEMAPADGTPVVLMHGFPDNTHLYDRLVPHLIGRRPVVRFDFLGWGRSDKPAGYPYTTNNQAGDLTAVVTALDERFGTTELILVAHDASGPPAIDWALAHPRRVAALVLLNTYYHWTPSLRRPPAIALYSTPIVRTAPGPSSDGAPIWTDASTSGRSAGSSGTPRYAWRSSPSCTRSSCRLGQRFGVLNDDLLATVLSRRRRIPELRRFNPPVRIIFGAHDRSLNPRVARNLAALFPHSELHLLDDAGHFVQVDQPRQVADLIVGTQAGANGDVSEAKDTH